MKKRLTTLAMVLLLVMAGAVACGDNGDVSRENPTNRYEEMDSEQMMKEIEKMKEEGIIDENGQPMPGVDLNDYPGLG